MSITVDREDGNYEIFKLHLEHNHMLQLPEARHLLPSQRRISEIQAFEIEIADDSGIAPKNAHEFASRRVGGSGSLSYTRRDHKNHLRTKRQRELKYGEAGSMLKYFQDKSIENPSFQHVVQLDCDEQIANVFWADAKMIIDYAHFGDVVTFDTTFGTNKEYRPFGVFVGFNHFRETVTFGASLLYDETFESFKWLFRAFLSVHNQKQPQTIFTDQDTAMGNAIEHVFSESKHGLCTFHIMQNAIKHLPNKKKDGETVDTPQEVDDEENGSSLLKDFSACMYEYDDPETFEEAFKVMRSKVKKQTWMDSIYKVKVKWAQCFMREAFTLGMRSTQLSGSLNNDLKNHLKSDLDINRFFHHFERAVEVKRNTEINSEYDSRKNLPRTLFRIPMVQQVSKLYTPAIFEAFQAEYGRSMAACADKLPADHEYMVKIGRLVGEKYSIFEEEHKVIGDKNLQTASCSCGQFERIGILCGHALKVLDLMNIKLLPAHYIMKRWTREARSGSIKDCRGRTVVENPKLDAINRCNYLSHKFYNLTTLAANSEECCILIENALDSANKMVKERLGLSTTSTDQQCDVQVTPEVPNELLTAARLKKKEAQKKSSKRKMSFLDRQHKIKRKTPSSVLQEEKKNLPTQTDSVENLASKNSANKTRTAANEQGSRNYESMGSFTDLLTAPMVEDIDDDTFQL
jgi:zinc finger SWIM domain-containing protein 3